MPLPRLKVKDIVYAIRPIKPRRRRVVVEYSVGEVREVSRHRVAVYFIGVNRLVRTYRRNVKRIYLASLGDHKRRKICNRCHILKPADEFEFNTGGPEHRRVRRPSCDSCRETINGVPFNPKDKARMSRGKPEGVYRCPVCRKTAIVDHTAKFRMDHSHATGKGRKWICDSCNTGLGRFDDSHQKLGWAATYLKRYP